MAWVYLVLAGGLEVFWSTFMKLSDGFSKSGYTVLTLGGNGCKFYLVGTGHQGAASGHILCHMDGHRCVGRGDHGHRAVSGTGHGTAHFFS